MATSATYAQSPFAYAPPATGSAQATGVGAAAEWPNGFSIFARVREYVRRKHVMYELSRLNERELADMGMTRCQIGQIYDPDFEQRRST